MLFVPTSHAEQQPTCIDTTANHITLNGADWSRLLDHLALLADTTDTTLSIIHIGDSHVQAGFFSAALRIPLQKQWGNAGRGLITPLKLTRSNEPTDYSITSPYKWSFHRCVGRKHYDPNIGLTGIAILPTNKKIDLTFSTLSRTDSCEKYNTLRLFHAGDSCFPTLQPIEKLSGLTITHHPEGETRYTWDTSDTRSSLHLCGTTNLLPDSAAIYGASLENGESGILLHTIGNNSACYNSYNNIPRFANKIASLTPQLIIISLGTNESVAPATTRESLLAAIDTLVTSIRQANPDALLLLTTPAENKLRHRKWRNKRRIYYYTENKRLPLVVETLREYAENHNIALWDWYAIAGGKNSCEEWVKTGCMARDHMHYTRQGYTLQGSLLYQSILNTYEQYILSHTR